MTDLRSEVGDLLSEATLRYSMVWEDDELLRKGLRIRPTDDVLCICSAGDNVLSLALAGARTVTAVDMNPAQTALLELKLAAIRTGSYERLTGVLGLSSADPLNEYDRLEADLPQAAQAFWDDHRHLLREGVVVSGRLETYILGFARNHLAELWPTDLFDRLVAAPSVEAQATRFLSEGLTEEFEQRFAWYFGREQMAAHGRDPAQFRHVPDGDVGAYFLGRFVWAMTHTRLRDNFYVRAFLSGSYGPLQFGPAYLRPNHFESLHRAAERVRVITGQMEQVLAEYGPFDKGAFSDMFEYMSEELAADVLEGLAGAFRPGGRLAWWCLLVPRPVQGSLTSLDDLADSLWAGDRAWFYRSFHLAAVAG